MVRASYGLGVACILAVAVIWSASSVLVQAIFQRAEFRRPFFLTWVANSLFMTTLPLRAVVMAVRRAAHRCRATQPSDADDVDGRAAASTPDHWATPIVRRSARAGLLVAPVWFAANCTYNYSMSMTSITSTTVISSSSVAFTLLLSAIWLRERITALKLLGVALCWVGNALTAIADQSGMPPANATSNASTPMSGNSSSSDGLASTTFRGDAVCLVSAMLYALYTVLIRRLEPSDLSLFFGFLGLVTFVLFGPVVLVLHLSGIEDLAALTPQIAGLLLVKGLFDNVLSDYLWAAAVLLTSPSVATIGMSLTVPLAVLSDVSMPPEWLIDPAPPTPLSVLAAVAVIGGFVAITAAGSGLCGDDSRDCGTGMSVPLLSTRRTRGTPHELDEPCEQSPSRDLDARRSDSG